MNIRRMATIVAALTLGGMTVSPPIRATAADTPLPITNITVNAGSVTLKWEDLGPLGWSAPDLHIEAADTLAGPWAEVLSPASKATDGATVNVGTDPMKFFRLYATDPFVPVTNITGVPTVATAGVSLTLTSTVIPYNATYQAIVWTVPAPATISNGNVLTAPNAGPLIVTATISNGSAIGTPYQQNFQITVNPKPYTVGEEVTLDGYVFRVLAVDTTTSGEPYYLLIFKQIFWESKFVHDGANTFYSYEQQTDAAYAPTCLRMKMNQIYAGFPANGDIRTRARQPSTLASDSPTSANPATQTYPTQAPLTSWDVDGIFFPLSCWEAGAYFSSDADRSVYGGDGYYPSWWLRSTPNHAGGMPGYVQGNGGIYQGLGNYSVDMSMGVRPAVWIK